MIDNAMILAAGFGKRLAPLTDAIPKPLIEVNQKTMISRIIANINGLNNIKNIIVNTHYLKDQIIQYLHRYEKDKNILISAEDEILGTGGGILNAMKKFGVDKLLIHNSDILFFHKVLNSLKILCKSWDSDVMDALLLLSDKRHILYEPQELGFVGDFYCSTDQKIIRPQNLNEANYKYTGVCIISKKCLENFAEQNNTKTFSLSDIFFQSKPQTYQYYKFYGIKLSGDIIWCDIGSHPNLRLANSYLNTEEAKNRVFDK